MDIPLEYHIALAGVLFTIGVFGVLFRRNVIMVMMAIELMLNAVNIVFTSASRYLGHLDGQVMVFFVMTVAACEAAVGLAMVIAIYRRYASIDTQFLRILRG